MSKQYPRAADPAVDQMPGGGGNDGGGPHMPSMDLVLYRLNQNEKQVAAIDGRLERIETTLNDIKTSLAGVSTKDTIRGWGLGIVVAIIATGLGVAALLMQSTGNQLTAFQTGLAAVQTVISAQQPTTPAPPAANTRTNPPK